jgi:uncharacterized protein YkwD
MRRLVLFRRTRIGRFDSRTLALLSIGSLLGLLDAQGRAFTAPLADVHGAATEASPAPIVQAEPLAQLPRFAQQAKPPARAQPPAEVRDPNCPGKDNKALMCRLVNEYRAKNGLKPVQLDPAVSRESQYWSDHLNKWQACWFLHHASNYHARMKAALPGRRFRENAACSGFEEGGAKYILEKWINSSGHRKNMLTPEWKTIGVGVTDNIWVINFTN